MNRNNALYRDLRGSMSQFRPLTADDVEVVSNGMLDYDWIEELLSEHGLSIDKVVFDPERAIINAFYADYENALYCEIYLLMRNFSEGHRPLFQELGRKLQHGNERLKQHQWQSFYTIDVPLPMQAYDFQHRMYDIEPESVFETWYHIYKRLDYSNGIWKSETIDYVFANAPACKKPPVEENGLITIYRGVGELSQHHKEAISWSTNPRNALWFANHSGFGTQLLIAEVDPKDVVAYFPGYSSENEVLVKPGSVQNVHSEEMYPANQDTFTRLAVPMLMEFRLVGQQALRFGYSTDDTNGFSVHGIHHILRVLYLSLLYVYHSGDSLSDMDKQILIYFSILHDVARVNENIDGQHGVAAVETIREKGLRIKGMRLSQKEYRIAEQIICYHCRDDQEGVAAIQSMEGLSRKDKDRAVHLYLIAKDMDGLDRVRFNGLDYRMLRTPFAARLHTDHYSRGAWEFGGRTYPEEWIGRRNTFEPYSTVLIAEGVSFEIVGEHEWTEEDLRVPVGDVAYEEDDVISVYLETWFDVDQKFGTHTHDEPDTWINLYALLNLTQNRLTMKYFICKQDSEEEFSYIPTTKERELVIRLIREAMEREGI